MDARDKLMVNLKQENQILRRENEKLKIDLMRFSGINLGAYNLNGNYNHNNHYPQVNQQMNNGTHNFNDNYSYNNQLYLPPINSKNNFNTNGNPKNSFNSPNRSPSNKMQKLIEYNSEKKDSLTMNSIKNENTAEKHLFKNLRAGTNESFNQQNNNLIQENLKLKEKIENLENAFISGGNLQNSNSQFTRNNSQKTDYEENDNSVVKT